MNKKVEIGLAVGILALLLLGLALFFLRSPKAAPAPVATSNQEPITPNPSPEIPVVPPAPPVPPSPQTTAMIFVERFGSYSSESDFANVTDVAPLVTASLNTRLKAVVAEQRTEGDALYMGVSTKVISQVIKSQTETEVVLLVSSQREEAIGSPENSTVRYQDITVTLVKEGDAWKVSDYSWSE